eukprot:scaffold13372_cov62-Phaeocystis_antarctica.AAC.4
MVPCSISIWIAAKFPSVMKKSARAAYGRLLSASSASTAHQTSAKLARPSRKAAKNSSLRGQTKDARLKKVGPPTSADSTITRAERGGAGARQYLKVGSSGGGYLRNEKKVVGRSVNPTTALSTLSIYFLTATHGYRNSTHTPELSSPRGHIGPEPPRRGWQRYRALIAGAAARRPRRRGGEAAGRRRQRQQAERVRAAAVHEELRVLELPGPLRDVGVHLELAERVGVGVAVAVGAAPVVTGGRPRHTELLGQRRRAVHWWLGRLPRRVRAPLGGEHALRRDARLGRPLERRVRLLAPQLECLLELVARARRPLCLGAQCAPLCLHLLLRHRARTHLAVEPRLELLPLLLERTLRRVARRLLRLEPLPLAHQLLLRARLAHQLALRPHRTPLHGARH